MASGKVSIKLLGMEETIKNIKKFETDKITEAKKIVKETALAVKKEAKAKAPVLTGQTKASIGYKTMSGGLAMKVYPKKGGGKYKAHWHEYGTSKMSARPFMTPAEQNAQSGFDQKVKKLVKEVKKI